MAHTTTLVQLHSTLYDYSVQAMHTLLDPHPSAFPSSHLQTLTDASSMPFPCDRDFQTHLWRRQGIHRETRSAPSPRFNCIHVPVYPGGERNSIYIELTKSYYKYKRNQRIVHQARQSWLPKHRALLVATWQEKLWSFNA